MIIKLIKYLGNDDNMSMMEEQFDMTHLNIFGWMLLYFAPRKGRPEQYARRLGISLFRAHVTSFHILSSLRAFFCQFVSFHS